MNKFKKRILNNGIPVYFVHDPAMKKVFVSYNIDYGTSGLWFKFNNEGKDYNVISGHAHYLEHLLGEHSKYGNMYHNFQLRMQNANAYTAQTVTSYHFAALLNFEKSLEELVHSIEEPVFNSDDVDASRHAIEEEASSYLDNTHAILEGMVERNLYSGFDLYDETYSPIGSRETTRLITTQSLYDCYNAFYTDDNKFFIIAGDIEEEKVMDLLNNIYSKITPHKSSLILPEVDYTGIRTKHAVLYRDVSAPIVTLGVKIKKPDDMDTKLFYYVVSALQGHLLDSKSYNELNKKGIIDSIESCNVNMIDDYVDILQSFTTGDRDESCGRLLEILSKRDITPKEYELAQKDLISTEIRCMDDKYDYLEDFPESFDYTEEYCDADFYRSVDYNTFMEAIHKCDFSQYSIGEVKKLSRRKRGR